MRSLLSSIPGRHLVRLIGACVILWLCGGANHISAGMIYVFLVGFDEIVWEKHQE